MLKVRDASGGRGGEADTGGRRNGEGHGRVTGKVGGRYVCAVTFLRGFEWFKLILWRGTDTTLGDAKAKVEEGDGKKAALKQEPPGPSSLKDGKSGESQGGRKKKKKGRR